MLSVPRVPWPVSLYEPAVDLFVRWDPCNVYALGLMQCLCVGTHAMFVAPNYQLPAKHTIHVAMETKCAFDCILTQ